MTEESSFEVPKPFHPGDRFVVRSRNGWSRFTADVFNLQGDRVKTWELQGQSLIYRADLVWDGRTSGGASVDPGPYLLHVRATRAAGGEREEVKAFVFQR